MIGQIRRERGLTQEELARRVRVSMRSVAAWESGSTTPRQRHLRALARALNVPVEQLLASTGDESRVEPQ